MSTQFDPYQQWLGITATVRPLNYYQLLGLKLFESEPPVIAEAADDRIALIEPHTKGEQFDLANRVMRELQSARTTLLQPQARAAYDSVLRNQLAAGSESPAPQRPSPALPPMAAGPGLPPVAMPMQAAPKFVPPQPAPVQAMQPPSMPQPQYVPQPQSMPQAPYAMPSYAAPVPTQPMPQPIQPAGNMFAQPATMGAPRLSQREPAGRARGQSGSSMLTTFLILGSGVSMLCMAIVWAFRDQIFSGSKSTSKVRQVVTQPVVQPSVPKIPIKRKALLSSEQTDLARAMSEGFTSTANMFNSSPRSMDNDFDSRPKKRPLGDFPSMAAPTAANDTTTPFTPPQTPPAKPDEIAAVDGTLKLVRTAIGNRDLDQAKLLVDLATVQAFSTDTMLSVERTKQLVAANEEFWKAVGEGVQKLQVMEELSYGDQKVTLLEVQEGRIAVRGKSGRLDYLLNKMPPELARVVLARAFDAGDARAKYLEGAFLAAEPKGDRDSARRLLQDAGAQGIEVAELLSLLDAGAGN